MVRLKDHGRREGTQIHLSPSTCILHYYTHYYITAQTNTLLHKPLLYYLHYYVLSENN